MRGVVQYRPADQTDLPNIAAFHVRVWRETYAGIATQVAYDALDVPKRLDSWRAFWTKATKAHAIQLALTGDQIVGLAACGPASQPAFGSVGELKHLYVDPDHASRGIGKQLLTDMAQQLYSQGFSNMSLAVVVENTAAQMFYKRTGGQQTGRFQDAGPLWKSDNLIYSWSLPITL